MQKNWAERQEVEHNFAGFVIAHQGVRVSGYQAHAGSAAGLFSGQIQEHEGEAQVCQEVPCEKPQYACGVEENDEQQNLANFLRRFLD